LRRNCGQESKEIMKARTTLMFAIAIGLLTVLVLPGQLSAQHTRYKLIDIPTLGGPAAIGQVDGTGLSQYINNPGVVGLYVKNGGEVVGFSTVDTTPDPFPIALAHLPHPRMHSFGKTE
jgi:hypothetical protein